MMDSEMVFKRLFCRLFYGDFFILSSRVSVSISEIDSTVFLKILILKTKVKVLVFLSTPNPVFFHPMVLILVSLQILKKLFQ
ncbi:hypothetical protein SAMN05443549_10229 [Flavobacterium fluvii]|uniref:Uncharacterized protein n=1 Tax=Flavobacterium fluvii TaxID=468056 RepID=A0A1M5H0P9_9FLAO|nr:hypothetical protein SAMN05443549_10229 [Flavobacterium fluvii]